MSLEGAIVDFCFETGGKSPLRFDLRAKRKLSHDPPADDQTIRPKQGGLYLSNMRKTSYHPTLGGNRIALKPDERSQSLAVHPDGSCFVLGADCFLRAYNAKGKRLWFRDVPGVVGRSISPAMAVWSSRLYGDGTIRWHRMDDGRELLALYVLADKQNWVAWTPEGFYAASGRVRRAALACEPRF